MEMSIYDKNYVILIELLKDKRLLKRWKQRELADKLKENQAFVSKYENRIRRLDVEEVRQICEALEVDFLDLMKEYISKI